MYSTTIISALLSLLALTTAAPAASTIDISVNVYQDNKCAVLDVEGYAFKKNKVCQQFIEQEGSIMATSAMPIKNGCVLQVFASTDCTDVLAAITINGLCEAPVLGPASSGYLVGC